MFGTPIQIRIEDREMIISNRCILPDGWTSETLMEPHDSIPYNPDIANVFYRMGYIESWGRGIQKICDECSAIGADLPKYEVLGNGIRLHFNALQSALIDQPKAPKYQGDTLDDTLGDTLDDKIVACLTLNPAFTQEELAEATKVSVASVKRTMKILSDSGRIVRVGGKRYGHWEVK
jgi:ATP-dependent DNA helicase RecG